MSIGRALYSSIIALREVFRFFKGAVECKSTMNLIVYGFLFVNHVRAISFAVGRCFLMLVAAGKASSFFKTSTTAVRMF